MFRRIALTTLILIAFLALASIADAQGFRDRNGDGRRDRFPNRGRFFPGRFFAPRFFAPPVVMVPQAVPYAVPQASFAPQFAPAACYPGGIQTAMFAQSSYAMAVPQFAPSCGVGAGFGLGRGFAPGYGFGGGFGVLPFLGDVARGILGPRNGRLFR